MCGLGEEVYYFRRRSREVTSDGLGDRVGGACTVCSCVCNGDRLDDIVWAVCSSSSSITTTGGISVAIKQSKK